MGFIVWVDGKIGEENGKIRDFKRLWVREKGRKYYLGKDEWERRENKREREKWWERFSTREWDGIENKFKRETIEKSWMREIRGENWSTFTLTNNYGFTWTTQNSNYHFTSKSALQTDKESSNKFNLKTKQTKLKIPKQIKHPLGKPKKIYPAKFNYATLNKKIPAKIS